MLNKILLIRSYIWEGVYPENIECGWQLIYDRLEKLGQLQNLTEIEEPNDFSTAHDGQPRRLDRKDMHL